MKATITNLRILNQHLRANAGADIALIEVAQKGGKYYTGNTPYRSWGRHTGTSAQIMKHMIHLNNICGLELPQFKQ